MSAQSIAPAFTTFQNIDGQPLEGGMIYIGTAGLAAATNQITVYWDAALTQTATQPIRTTGGYPMNSGTPGVIYTGADDFSIAINDKNNSTVISALNKTEFINSASINYTSALTGGVQRTLSSKLSDVVSVKDFGAVGDGVTDDAAAIQAAIDSGAEVINFPNGDYLVQSIISMSPNQALIGNNSFFIIGSTLTGSGTQNNTPIISMSERTTINGFIFKTETQAILNGTTVAPVEHPWAIQVQGVSHTNIIDVAFLGCWRGIVAGSASPHECMTIDGIKGACFQTCIYIDQNTDVDRLNNIQINPNYVEYYGGSGNFTTAAMVSYIRDTANASALHIFKADWLQISNCFIYGYYRGVYIQTGVGAVSGNATLSITNSGIDGCKYCLVSTGLINLEIVSTTFSSTQLTGAEDNKCIIATGDGSFQISSCLFVGQTYDAGVDFAGTGSLTVGNCKFYDHVYGILASSGYINLYSLTFQSGGSTSDIALSGTVKAYISNCQQFDGTTCVVTGDTSATVPVYSEYGSGPNFNSPITASSGINTESYAPAFIANGATNYFKTLAAADGFYMAFGGQDASTSGAIYAIAMVRVGSSSITVIPIASNGMSVASSGYQIGLTNSAGGDINADFGILKLNVL